jgi:hypothetical protein
MNQDRNEPVIDEIREVRTRISARVDNDPVRLVAYYMNLQAQKYQDRLIAAPKATGPTDQSAA